MSKKLLGHLKSQSSEHFSLQLNSSNSKIIKNYSKLTTQFFPVPIVHNVAKNAFQLLFNIKYTKEFRSF